MPGEIGINMRGILDVVGGGGGGDRGGGGLLQPVAASNLQTYHLQ